MASEIFIFVAHQFVKHAMHRNAGLAQPGATETKEETAVDMGWVPDGDCDQSKTSVSEEVTDKSMPMQTVGIDTVSLSGDANYCVKIWI